MSSYRTPLPAALARTLESAINRVLAMDADSSRRLARLDRRKIRLELEGLGIGLDFHFSPLGVRVDAGSESEGEPETVITGTPVALFALAIPDDDGHWGSTGSRVQISGDATLARDVETLFSRLDPDWEGQMANWFGDVLSHQLVSGARNTAAALGQTARELEGITAEFLGRSGGPLAQSQELEEFGRAVDGLRDATDRLEARLRIIRARRAETPNAAENDR